MVALFMNFAEMPIAKHDLLFGFLSVVSKVFGKLGSRFFDHLKKCDLFV